MYPDKRLYGSELLHTYCPPEPSVGLSSLISDYMARSFCILRAEDPTQVMNLSYEKQLEQLQNLRRAIAQVMTEEKHIELLEQRAECPADHFTTQALHMGREELARQALQRKEALITQVDGYKTQMGQLQAQEAHPAEVESKLNAWYSNSSMSRTS